MAKKVGLYLSEETVEKMQALCEKTYRKPSALISWLIDQKSDEFEKDKKSVSQEQHTVI